MAETSRKKGKAQLEKDALDRAKQYYNTLPGPNKKANNGTKAAAASPNLKRSAASVATADKPSASKRKKQAAAKKSPTAAAKKERLTKRQQAGLAHAQRWAAQQGIAVKGAEPPVASSGSATNPKAIAQKRQVSVEHRIKAEPEASRSARSVAPTTTKRKPRAVGSRRRDPPIHEESFPLVDNNAQPDVMEEEDMQAVPPTQSYFFPLCGIVLLLLGACILVQKEGSIAMASRWVHSLFDTTVISTEKLIGHGSAVWKQLAAIPLAEWANNVMAEAEALSRKLVSFFAKVLEEITSGMVEDVQAAITVSDPGIDGTVVDLPVEGTMPH